MNRTLRLRPLPRPTRLHRAALLAAGSLLAACQGGATPEPEPASAPLRITPPAAVDEGPVLLGVSAAVRAAARADTLVAALDERGVPSLLVAAAPQPASPGATAELAAREHLARNARALGLDDAALAGVTLRSVGAAGEGVLIARFQQRFEDVEVYRGEARLLLKDDRSLAAASAHLVAGTAPRPRAASGFHLPPTEAVAATLAELFGVAVVPRPLIAAEPDPDYTHYLLSDEDPVELGEPARVKKVWFRAEGPSGERLAAAWFVELYAARPGEPMQAYRLVLDATDGSVLERRDLTLSDSFNYRVWADATGDKRPLDSPLTDMTPHPTGMNNGFKGMPVPTVLVSMEGFNKNPMGAADPWLPPGAVDTQGNNVDAYVDRSNPNGLTAGDFRASVTSPGTFDRAYNLNASPIASNDQGMAAVTNLFYLVNWMHDYWYDSGFDEKAGNAQKDNYGRGGMANDALRAESQDNVNGGARNNANMSTPGDGMAPRMQVFVWTVGGNESRTLTVTPPGNNVTNSAAGFGPAAYDVTADLVLVVDGQNPTSDGCSALSNAAAVKGKIAVLDRGTCTFQQKVGNAEAAGAVGAIIIDNVASNNPPNLGGGQGPVVNIPTMGVRLSDGTALKTSMMMGAVKARLLRVQPPLADASFDNTVTGHEWGHYLHHRLADCSLQQCGAMSEGWADFTALHLVLRDGDNLDGAYPVAPYAAQSQADSFFGLRRMPYSTDLTKNGLTFKHISNGQALPNLPRRMTGAQNSEVHNAGEVWAEMMWEVYVALIKNDRGKGVSFADSRRKMANYVVAGLQLTPTDATYLEQRDAVLAAIAARSQEDLGIAAAAFARRGAGSCAKGPNRDSRDFVGVVEDFQVRGKLDIGDVAIDDGVVSCDKDGQLDAEETGNVTVKVQNGSPAPLTGAKVTVTPSTPGLTVVGNATVPVPDLPPLGSATVKVQVALAGSVAKITSLDLEVKAEAPNTCEASITRKVSWRGNYDELADSATTDDAEASKGGFTGVGDNADKIWSRGATGMLQHAWRGLDWGSPSDTALTSPDLLVSASDSFTLAYDHKYAFEQGDEMGQHHFYDGAIVEITSDGGMSWQDVAGWQQPGYNGTITNISGNALADRTAYVGQNPAWPSYNQVRLDFGKNFAGKTVKVRFRISTDQAAGEYGWEIDNIAIGGITNKPFPAVIEDRGVCKQRTPLVANAGPDRRAVSNDPVTLDGSGTTGGDGTLTYRWTQTAGPAVSFLDPTRIQPTFIAPVVTGETVMLSFKLSVSDGTQLSEDGVDVAVGAALSDGCCRVGSAPHGGPRGVDVGPALGLLGLALLSRRRRAKGRA